MELTELSQIAFYIISSILCIKIIMDIKNVFEDPFLFNKNILFIGIINIFASPFLYTILYDTSITLNTINPYWQSLAPVLIVIIQVIVYQHLYKKQKVNEHKQIEHALKSKDNMLLFLNQYINNQNKIELINHNKSIILEKFPELKKHPLLNSSKKLVIIK